MNKFYPYLFFIIAFLFSVDSVSQIKVFGIVIDATTKKGVSFASIVNIKTKNGIYTTEKGLFSFLIGNGDSIQISCVGYKTLTIPINGVSNNTDTILLTPYLNELSEVIVSPVSWLNYKKKIVGYASLKSNWHIAGPSGIEYAVYIPGSIKTKGAYIGHLLYKMQKWSSDTVVVRLHLFTVNPDGTPGHELLDSNYIEVLTKKMNEVVSFNIASSKIILPEEGVFAGLEWVGVFDSKNNIIHSNRIDEPRVGFNSKSKTSTTYERVQNGEWQKADLRKLYLNSDFENKVLSKSIPNASFGILIYMPK